MNRAIHLAAVIALAFTTLASAPSQSHAAKAKPPSRSLMCLAKSKNKRHPKCRKKAAGSNEDAESGSSKQTG